MRSTTYARIRGIVSISLALGIVACGNSASPASTSETPISDTLPTATATEPTQESTVPIEVMDITIARYGGIQPIMWPILVADALDLWSEHGLKAEVVEIPTGPEQVAAVANGSVDAMHFTGDGTMLVNPAGQDLVAIVGTHPSQIFGVLAAREFERPNADGGYPAVLEDLRDSRVGISALGSNNYIIALTLMGFVGLTENDVEFVALGGTPTIISGFQAGQTDWAVVTSPGIELLTGELGLADLVLDLRNGDGPDLFSNWVGQAVFAKESAVNASPEKYRRLADVYIEAIDFIKDPANKTEVLRILNELAGEISADTVELLYENNRDFLDARISCSGIENAAEFLILTERMTEDDAPSCEDFMSDVTREDLLLPS